MNRLAGSGSPYLEQHADNPVNWQPWGDKAFEEARQRDLPILVSIGYSTCHWCHVMARESFEVQDVADLMNSLQVNIKVDREQHPGVDAVYMEAAQALTGSGGWPLNVFVGHDGRPFLAVTYLPANRWADLLTQVNRIWKEDRSRIHDAAASLSKHLSERRFPAGGDSASLPETLLNSLRRSYDTANPGFVSGSSPMKFPPSQSIDWLLEHGGADGREMALNILVTMKDSGLHDRVGGGFHRYSTDERWRVPHFEKMAYDNAQLMGLYARAGFLADSENDGDDLLAVARNIAEWFLICMRVSSDDGGFIGYATATDADDPLGEGTYFAWPPSELEAVLGAEDGAWLAMRWDISGAGGLPSSARADSGPKPRHGGEFEPVANWIPHPRGRRGYPETRGGAESRRDGQREAVLIGKLKAAREKRPGPARDDKVLTDQNALVLEGFSRLARYGGGEKYLQAAVELADLLSKRARGKLERTAGIDPYITDYGYLAMALAGVFSVTGDAAYIGAAEAVARQAVEHLADGNGAYYSTPAEGGGVYRRVIEDFDGPSPTGQHALGIAFARLYTVTGKRDWKDRAEALLTACAAAGSAAPAGAPSLVRLVSILSKPLTFVVAGPDDRTDTKELLETVLMNAGPDMMVVAADRASLSGAKDWAELEGRIGIKEPQLLACSEGSCMLPAFTVKEVIERLKYAGRQ